MIIDEKIIGTNIYLRSLGKEDVTARYVDFLNDAQVNAYMETRFQQWNNESIWRYLQSMNTSNDNLMMGIFTKEHVHIGNIKCGPIHPIHRFSSLSLFIGDKNYWGKGIATEAIRLMCCYSFEKFNLYKISAGMYLSNTGSLRAFLKVGFQLEGIFKNHYQLNDKERTDVLQVGITKEHFQTLPKNML